MAAAAAAVVVVVVEGLRLFSVGIGRNPDPVSDPFLLSLLGCFGTSESQSVHF